MSNRAFTAIVLMVWIFFGAVAAIGYVRAADQAKEAAT